MGQSTSFEKVRTTDPGTMIKISFGKSTSKKREEAVNFISKQPTFEKIADGLDAVYSAEFSTNDINTLYNMLDLTSGWKTQKIEIEGKEINSTELRNSLWCYRQKNNEKAGSEWCMKSDNYEIKNNPFNCKQLLFIQFESGVWEEFGYIDTDAGEWVFDKDSIKDRIMGDIERLKYCPIFKSEKVLNVIDTLPDRINPKTDIEWGFRSQDLHTWIWNNGEWISSWGGNKFPSFSLITGIVKISKKERNNIIMQKTSEYGNINKNIIINLSENQTTRKKRSS
ncbi:MAG TPA: hypothetical protein VGD14_01755, partial [bacterium]